MFRLPSLVALALFASMAHATPALAVWSSSGNAVADSSSEEEVPTSITPLAGGCVVVYTFDNADSLRINRLFGATGTKAWGTSGVRVNPGGNAGSLGLVTNDSTGGVWVAWYDQRTAAPGIYVQRFSGAGTPLLTSGGVRIYHRTPAGFGVATSSAGELLLAFVTSGDSVIVQRVSQSGVEEWPGDGVLLATSGSTFANGLSVFPDGEGCLVVYGRFLPISGSQNSYQQVFANRVSSAGATQWGAQGAVVYQNIGNNAIVHRADWNGQSLFVSWLEAPSFYNFLEPYPIRAQRLSSNGVRQWGTLGVTAFTPVTSSPFYEPTTSAGDHALVADNAGGIVLAWFDTRHWHQPAPNGFDHFEDIYGQRLDAVGAPQWQANGAVLDSLPGGIDDLRAVTDAAGGMLLSYTDHIFASNDRDIRLRRVLNTGTSPYVVFVNSISGSEPASIERGPVLCADGAGGAFIAWEDNRDPSSNLADVYAAHRNGGTGSVFAASMLVTAPNGGERFSDLTTMPIRWTSNFGGTVAIRLSRAPGQYSAPIPAFGTPNDGVFDWDISDDQGSTTCRIVISDFETGTVMDSSNAFFTICEGFSTSAIVTLGGSQRAGLVADFNEDGVPDVAATTPTGVAVQLASSSGGVWLGTFAAATTVSLAGARRIVAADLDENGILDIVATHTGGVSYLPGNGAGGVGNGTFGAPVLLWPSSRAAHGLDAADLNADGIVDLVVTLRDSAAVEVLIGRGTNGIGNATFATTTPLGTQAIPERVVLADLNANGTRDMLVACRSGFLTRYLGTAVPDPFGAGTFGSRSDIAAGDSAATLVVEDFNEDGALDILVGNDHSTNAAADGFRVFRGIIGAGGTPTGAFIPGPFHDVGTGDAIAAMDLDGDGRTDVLTAQTLALRALHGGGTGAVGDGTFTEDGGTVGVLTPQEMIVADFNRDGTADVFVVSGAGSSNASRVFVGGCAPQVATALGYLAPVPNQALFIDTDFRPAWTEGPANGVTRIELSRDGGTTWEPLDDHRTNMVPTLPVTAPATSQGRLRVTDALHPASSAMTPGDFPICRAFANGTTLAVGGDIEAVRLADLDRDGHLDAIMAAGLTRWRLGNGDGTFGPEQSDLHGLVTGFAVADFDDDGVLDLAGGTGGQLRVLRGGRDALGHWDGTFADMFLHNTPTFEVVAADFNEDGIEDLVSRSLETTIADSIHVYLGRGANGVGDGTFELKSVHAASVLSGDLEVADLDRDGILDIVGASRGAGGTPPFGLTLLFGRGSNGVGNGTFDPPVRLLPGYGVSAVAVGDMDRDGAPDIVAAGAAGLPRDSIAVLLGDLVAGQPSRAFAFSSSRRYAVPREPTDIELADVDGNGLLDMVTTCYDADSLVVLLRRGSTKPSTGSYVRHQQFATSATPLDAVVADVNGDGMRDVVGVDRFGRILRVHLGACGPLPPRSIATERPAGGESWDPGDIELIEWSAPGVAHVDVELSRDGGQTWQTLASAHEDTSLSWKVVPPATAQARIRVVDHDGHTLADVTPDFTITSNNLDAGPGAIVTAPSFSTPRPNPSRGPVGFVLALPAAGRVAVEVFDLAGRRVRVLEDRLFAPGEHRLAWDGRDGAGVEAGAGMYLIRARGPGIAVERKFVRLR